MPWTAWLVASGAVAVAIGALRVHNAWRLRVFLREQANHPTNADGVFAGAEPFTLDADGDCGALVLHGFNDTPQSVRELALALHANGWRVSVPLLPRHGRADDQLARRGAAAEWIGAARAAWRDVAANSACAIVVGQSIGGALATLIAAKEDRPPDALVLVAPFLSIGWWARVASRMWRVWSLMTPVLLANRQRGLVDPAARAASLGHGVFTPRLVAEVRRMVDHVQPVLPRVGAPTLMLASQADYRIPARSATRAFNRIGAADKRLHWIAGAGHVLTADRGREALFKVVTEWLDVRVGGRCRPPSPSQPATPA